MVTLDDLLLDEAAPLDELAVATNRCASSGWWVGISWVAVAWRCVGGTPDGPAPAPYIRESRRIEAEFTVLEQHIAYPLRPHGPELFRDTVGIGCYRIDLHP